MYSPYTLLKLAKARQSEMLELAREERLARESQRGRLRLRKRFTWKVGDWMIGFGQKLKVRQRPIL
ncbi:MAG: hypothetical protein ACE5I2_00730 [Anaerolineae bacterium]